MEVDPEAIHGSLKQQNSILDEGNKQVEPLKIYRF
jgi:hypothetical protein